MLKIKIRSIVTTFRVTNYQKYHLRDLKVLPELDAIPRNLEAKFSLIINTISEPFLSPLHLHLHNGGQNSSKNTIFGRQPCRSQSTAVYTYIICVHMMKWSIWNLSVSG